MNFLEIVRFEIDYRLRRPYTWILGGVFVAMAGCWPWECSSVRRSAQAICTRTLLR